MNRFYIPPEKINNHEVFFSGEQTKHIRNVLRLKVSDIITVFDGLGNEYEVFIDKIDKTVSGKINKKTKYEDRPKIKITLLQGLAKGDKMDFVIQKCTEIGVTKFVPVITERTIVKLEQAAGQKKIERWQKIAIAATEQCGGLYIPEISPVMTFDQALVSLKNFDFKLIPWEKEKSRSIKTILKKAAAKDIAVFIGPEGGFSEDEIEQAKNAEVIPVTLGPRILRSETAGLVVAALIVYELNDIGEIGEP